MFQDDDGKAYIICSSANGRAYQYVIPLRESDFLDIDEENIKMLFYDEDGSYIDENGEVDKKDKTGIEGNCMFKYNGNYYYYPDGLTIVNDNKNNDMFKFALDVDDETKPAYYIQFDTSSVVINDNDSKIHNGSVKIENDLIYIWQEKSSKELDTGWIRVYCDLKKY